MAIYILKPIGRGDVDNVGGVLTFESNETATNIATHFGSNSSGTDTNIPNAGILTSQLTDMIWSNNYSGNTGYQWHVMKVSGVGPNGTDTPTIANVNSSRLVTELSLIHI